MSTLQIKAVRSMLLITTFIISSLFNVAFALNESGNQLDIASKDIYLVRHAEKNKSDHDNPELTENGKFRAKNIANMLKNKNISEIYSTRYNRTMQTAQPLAKLLGIDVLFYDPLALEHFAQTILSKPGNILIVGHSNTTPYLVSKLGGDSGEPINESEYDRVYQLTVLNNKVFTKLLHSKNAQE